MGQPLQQPILVFDSGIGGLSVLDEIRQLLPNEAYVYLFDNARMPYGELTDEVLIEGCVSLVCRIVKQSHAKIVVIACNTASTLVLPYLRAALNIPVVGVVPAIKPAAALSQLKHIALLATPGTIRRQYTQQLITDFAGDCQVQLCASSALVLLAERKLAGEQISAQELAQAVAPLLSVNIDVIVLGCTHFPILKSELSDLFGKHVQLIDSGAAIAKRVACLNQVDAQANFSLIGLYTTTSIADGLQLQLRQRGFQQLISLTC